MKSTARMFALGIALLAGSAMSVSAQPKINDAQIATVAVAANQVDVDAGKLALSKARNGEIKKFARRWSPITPAPSRRPLTSWASSR
jgi:predicted outer membrane protein